MSRKLEARPVPLKGGWGVFAREPIDRGEVLAMWGGRVIPVEEIYHFSELEQRYLIQVEEGLFLTPSQPTEAAEYFNHSCEPSAGLSGQMALVALRDIEPGEEVCFDYAMSESHPLFEFDCLCGSPLCRGRITAEDWREPDLQRRYAGFFSPYLQRRIEAIHRAEALDRALAQRVRAREPRRVGAWRARTR
jgi:hypothetical protein